ncbi:hypothetical protein E2C05_16410 [Paracraurococcus ruber]|nr:hypothetical protein E2C05_16410 [Paracraurococcus ruber]
MAVAGNFAQKLYCLIFKTNSVKFYKTRLLEPIS